MEIKTFEDIMQQIRLPEQILSGIRERLCASSNGVEFQFTDLQKMAFNNEKYWLCQNDDPFPAHIVVQGATSSGKTLVSEMSVIECLNANPKKKAIVLVPLKAMVRERRDRFSADLPDERIYASSNDFQDHDIDIINGNYDVAIIVYEKFFAMLSQSMNQILQDCALLVVDELQMLSSEGRGPKLEISIQKVMHHNTQIGVNDPYGTYTRIMCLTTCDCKVNCVEKWLTVKEMKPISIRSNRRPVGLEEYVLQVDGTLRGHYIRGERDEENHIKEFKENPNPLEVYNYNKNNRPEIAKRQVLLALLKKIYSDNPAAKVLVFASDKRRTQEIAEYISREKILPYNPLPKGVIDNVKKYDNDDGQDVLKRLFPYGIAFHNASLSVALREFVEKSFETDGGDEEEQLPAIKLIVATETLTIGMNMPVDVMILYNARVPKGKDIWAELTSQEYKNFVGRAGRLGLSKHVGQSYILALNKADADAYWGKYVDCKMEEIKSALIKAQETVQAPYYLSLMARNTPYSIQDMEELQEKSFSRCCDGTKIRMEKVMEELRRAFLCVREECGKLFEEDDVQYEENTKSNQQKSEEEYIYQLTDLGEILAPYALSLDTSKQIRRFFLNGGYRRYMDTRKFEEKLQERKGGMPLHIKSKEIEEDVYLLDILYTLCKTNEVKNVGQLRLPSDDKLRVAKSVIWTKLKEMVEGDEGGMPVKCQLWEESNLRYILEGDCNGNETEEYQAVMRAILLWHWTKGKTITDIKKETGFDKFVRIYTGEMARVAEVVSYELDAVYRCIANLTKSIYVDYGEDDSSPKAMYSLSTRVNYGMPRNLVIIANRHLYGLDRSRVLSIGKKAKECGYDNPVQYLERGTLEEFEGIITEQQRNELLSMIARLYFRDNIDEVLENLRFNPRDYPLSLLEANALRQMYDMNGEDDCGSKNALKDIFWNVEGNDRHDQKFFDKSIVMADKGKVYELSFDGTLNVIVADYVDDLSTDYIERHFKMSTHANINLLLVTERNMLKNIHYDEDTGRWCMVNTNGAKVLHNIDLAMTYQVFAMLLTNAIALEDTKADALSQFIADTKGAFEPRGMKTMCQLLKNYENKVQALGSSGNEIRIVCDYRNGFEQEACKKLLEELAKYKILCHVLTWGEKLREADPMDAPTVLYITEESLQSNSVSRFWERLRQHGFKKACAVFENEEQFYNLNGRLDYPFNGLIHLSSDNVVEKARYILAWSKQQKLYEDKIESYIVGVSYSHTLVNDEERPSVKALKRIVQQISNIFGEANVVFDGNDSFKDKFDRNGAVEASLGLYKKCRYFIILDDNYYTDGKNCPREANVIKRCLIEHSEEYKQHVWYLRPRNDAGSKLFDEEKDFCKMLDYTEKNIEDIVGEIKRVILSENEVSNMEI